MLIVVFILVSVCSREHINPPQCGFIGGRIGWSGASTGMPRGIHVYALVIIPPQVIWHIV